MNRPWMPLYVADYLADTAHLSTTEHGAYLLLIMFYWTKGGLPKDEESIRRITRMTSHQWTKSRVVLASLFLEGWRHKRIDEELAQVLEKSRVNSANAKRRLSERSANAQRTHTHSQSQSEEEDIIVDARARPSVFTEGSKRLAEALWRALDIRAPLGVPPELAGTDWRAVEWERAGWTEEIIASVAKRVGPGKPLSYYEKVMASDFAKLNAPLPTVEIKTPQTLTVYSGTSQVRSGGSLTESIKRELAELERSEGADLEMPVGSFFRVSN